MYLSTRPHEPGVRQSLFLKRRLTGLSSEFSFSCHTSVKERSLPYYLTLARERTIGCISTYIYIYLYLSTRPHEPGVRQSLFLKRRLTGLSSEFSFSCHTSVKERSLPYYLTLARERTIGCIPFPRPRFELGSPSQFPMLIRMKPWPLYCLFYLE